jgi:hypothetical protein
MARLDENGLARLSSQIKTILSNATPAKHAHQHQSPNVILWDGNETGHTVIEEPGGYAMTYVHMSDVVPTDDELSFGVACGISVDGVIMTQQYSYEVLEPRDDGVVDAGIFVIVPSDNFVDAELEATFPKKGIYFSKYTDSNIYLSSLYIPGITLTTPSDPLTAEMIGAARAFHTHDAEQIMGGTFPGAMYASYQKTNFSLLRNSKLVSTETTPTVDGEIYWTYE